MSKKKTRDLWLHVSGRPPRPMKPRAFWTRIKRAVEDQDYDRLSEWDVNIRWKNKTDAPWRSDDFVSAMEESAASSRGWDKAVIRYLDRQIERSRR